MHYRRNYHRGGLYFFTLVSFQRRPILTQSEIRQSLREAVYIVRDKHPFEIVGWVLLPDHLHTIWQLPENNADYSMRWNQIKRRVSYRHREMKIWQGRFWEHTIRDDQDFARHFDYLHVNPVKHGYVSAVVDWPYSTFHRYVREGIYPRKWGGNGLDFTVAYDG
ncbi:MAG: transposase [Neisseria sp.]|nr:transposase [Neisseria sp.]